MGRSEFKGNDSVLDWGAVRIYHSDEDEPISADEKSFVSYERIEIPLINIPRIIQSINNRRSPNKISSKIAGLLLKVGVGVSTENNAAVNLINAFNRINENIQHYDLQSQESPEQFSKDRFARYSDSHLLQISTCIINHKKMLSILSEEIEEVISQCSTVDDHDLINALRSAIEEPLKKLKTTEVQILLSMKNRLLATQIKVVKGQMTLAQLSADNYARAKAINLFREHIRDIYNDRNNYQTRDRVQIERLFNELNLERNQLTPALNQLEANNNELKLEDKTPAQLKTMSTEEYLNYLAQERLRNNYVIWHAVRILAGNNHPTITLASELKSHDNFFSEEKLVDFRGLDANGNIAWVESINTWIEKSEKEFKELKRNAPHSPNRALSDMQRCTDAQIQNSKTRFNLFKQNVADNLAEKGRKAIEHVLMTPGEYKEEDVFQLIRNLANARLFINKARGKASNDYIADLDIMKILSEIISRRLLDNNYGNVIFQQHLVLLLNFFHPVAKRVKDDFISDRVIDLRAENYHTTLAPEHGEARINGILKYFLEPAGLLPDQTLLALTKSQLDRIPQEKKPNPTFPLQSLKNSNGRELSDVPATLTKYFDGRNRNIVKAGGEREHFLNDPNRVSLINKINILGRFVGFSASTQEVVELEKFELDASIQSIEILRKELEAEIHSCEEGLKNKGLLYRLRHANAYAMQKAWVEQLKTCLGLLNTNRIKILDRAFSEDAIKHFIENEHGYVDLRKLVKIKNHIQKYEYNVLAEDKIDVVKRFVSQAVIREFKALLPSNISNDDALFDRWDGIVAFLIENNMGSTIRELIDIFDGKNSAIAELVFSANLNHLKFENDYNPVLDYAEKRFNHVFNIDYNWDENDDSFLNLNRTNEKFMEIFNSKAAAFIQVIRAQGQNEFKHIKIEVFSLINRFANAQNIRDYGVVRINQLLNSPLDAKEQDVPLLDSLDPRNLKDLEQMINYHIDNDRPWTSVANKIVEVYGTLEQKQAWNSKWISWALEADYSLSENGSGQDPRSGLLAKLTALNGDVTEYKKFFGESNLNTLRVQLEEMTSVQKEMKPIIFSRGTCINELYNYFIKNIPGELPDAAEINERLHRQALSTILVAGVDSFVRHLSENIQPMMLGSEQIFVDKEDEAKNIDLYYSLYKIPLIDICKSKLEEQKALGTDFLLLMKDIIQTIKDMPFSQVKSSYEMLVNNLPDASAIPTGLRALASGRPLHNPMIIITELGKIQLNGLSDKTKIALKTLTDYLTVFSKCVELKKLLDARLCMVALNEIKTLLKKTSSSTADKKLEGLFEFYKKYIKDNYDVKTAISGNDKLIKGIAVAEAIYTHFVQILGEDNIESMQLKPIVESFKAELKIKQQNNAIPSISKAPSASFSLQSTQGKQLAADRAQNTRLDNLALQEIQRYIDNGTKTRVHQSREVFFKSYEQVEIKCEPNTYANRVKEAVKIATPTDERRIAREYALFEIYRIASETWTDANELKLAELIMEINQHYLDNKSFYVNGENTKQRLLSLGNLLILLSEPAEKILAVKRMSMAEDMSKKKGHTSPGAA